MTQLYSKQYFIFSYTSEVSEKQELIILLDGIQITLKLKRIQFQAVQIFNLMQHPPDEYSSIFNTDVGEVENIFFIRPTESILN